MANKSKYYYQRLNKRKKRVNLIDNDGLNSYLPQQYGYYPEFTNTEIMNDGFCSPYHNYDPFYYYYPYNNYHLPNNIYNPGPEMALDNLGFLDTSNAMSEDLTPVLPQLQEEKEKISIPSVVKEKRLVMLEPPTNLRDLVDIIDKNEISQDIEYNIDLKSLNNIKSELVELRDMIGMERVKNAVFQQLIYFIQNLHIGNDILTSDFKHTVILGPPGTGKTKVAKIIGNMYSKLGILKNNIFKKVTRNDLIAGYLGQTAIKTKKVIDDCLGGVLFIDEAYSLANEDREDIYSKECLDTLCESLSDHKDELMVIIAGYEDEMNNRFFTANKGLESRFIWRFKIEQYNAVELMRIFTLIVIQSGWSLLDETKTSEKWFQEKKDKFQGLGRDMEVLFTYTKMAHSLRIYGKDVELKKKISLEDMDQGYKMFLDNTKKDDMPSFINSIYI
jgi:SpoVK/Ycf46/Vps4 family AAA+-type ATPase